ncbi:MAG: hypothetical protein ACRENE_13265 [Polyangiaceae bacterium]
MSAFTSKPASFAFLLSVVAASAACSSSGSGGSASNDDGGPDSTAESGSDDATASDSPSNDGPAVGPSDASEAGNGDSGASGDASADAPPVDASPEAAHDASVDAGADAAVDSETDAGADVAVDVAEDVAVDVAVDAPHEAGGPPIRLFDGNSPGGALGGRSGIDTLCANAAQTEAGPRFANVHGFITVNVTDEIKDMPANYGVPTDRPIESSTGAVVASDWSHLLGGSIDIALTSADVILSGNFWYSGSNPDGSIATTPVDGGGVHPFTCSGWTDGATLFDGAYGLAYSTTSNWMTSGGQATCGLGSYRVLCLGW